MRYWSGVITGLIVSAVGALFALTHWGLPHLVDQLPQLTSDEVPRATSIVTSAGWAVATPVALVVLLLAAIVATRRRETVRLVALILVAVASLAVIAFTLLGIAVPLSGVAWEICAG